MTETAVTKGKTEKDEISRWFDIDGPLLRNNLFTVNPFAMMRQVAAEMNGAAWYPAIDVKEHDNKLFVTVELPGMKKEDVKVEITGDRLTLEGEKKHEKEEKKEGYFHCERSYGKFYRAIPLPEGVKAGEAIANFTNGVLEITVPIPEAKKKTQQVPINEGVKAKAA